MPHEQSLAYRLSVIASIPAVVGAVYAGGPSLYARVLESDATRAAELQHTFDEPFFWLTLVAALSVSVALITRPK